MEGKAVLFKRFADVDSIDELDGLRRRRLRQRGALSRPSFGGINLEDIKALRCFIIEQRLRELLEHPGLPRRPARHRDHHRPASSMRSHLTGRDIRTAKMVVSTARVRRHASPPELIRRWACRTRTPSSATPGRHLARPYREGMNQWNRPTRSKPKPARSKKRSGRRHLPRPVGQGRDDPAMVKAMAANPIIFACANPDPEITPEEVAACAARCDRRDRPQRLPQSRSTTCWAFPTSSAARSTRLDHQRAK